jgi:hypothetical protein
MGAQRFQKSRTHLKILMDRWMIVEKFQPEDLQSLGTSIKQYLVAKANWRPEFVHPSLSVILYF